MSAPNITVGQVALDPYNKVLYYRKLTGEMVSTSLDWLLNGNDYGRMVTGDEVTISNDLIVNGNLTVNGTTTTINAEEVTIEDSILILNSNATGTPTANAGIEIERGDQTNVQLLWNELENKWQFTNDGVTYYDINSIIEDSVTLGYHTVGDYIKNLVAGTGVSITNNSGEGATPTISIGQPVSTTSTVTFALVNANLAGNVTGNLTGNVTGNVSGQVSDLSNHGINSLNDVDATPSSGQFLKWNGSSWVNDAIDLTTDTVGDYVKNLVAGTGVSIINNSGEGATPNISIGQPVGTSDTVTFNTVNADLTGDVTGQVSDISNHGISDLSDVTIADPANGDFLRYNGANWINDPVNLTTDTVGDYVAKLAAGTGITITNNSGEGATPNIAFTGSIDNITDIVITSAQNGQILEYDGTNWVNTVRPSSEPIGHENKDDSVISFNESTREFSISPASTSYTVWCTGKRYVKTSTEKVTIPDTSGLYYIYFNSSGSLAYKTTFFTWDQDTPTAYIYWNDVDNKAYFFADERHGVTLDWATHEYLHRTRGAAIANGFGINNYTISGDGTSDAHAKLDLADGTFFDEDLQIDVTHSATPTVNTWEQILQGNAEIPVFYRLNNHWKKDSATEFPLKQGESRPKYNSESGGTWSTTDVANNHFGVSWIIATNNLNEPIIAVLGQASYGDKGSVEADFYGSLDLDGFPIVEFRPLYKIIYECKDSYTNTPKAAFRTIQDLRSIISADQGVSSVAVSDHGSMTGLQDDDHPQYFNSSRHDAHDHSNALSTSSINDLGDVAISGAIEGQGLVWNGTNWSNTTIPLSLDGLTDVVITSATPNQVLKFNGTNWVNDESPSSISGTTFTQLLGDGVQSQFVINHGLSTRNIVVSILEENAPYGAVSSHWEATTLDEITVYFASAPDPSSIRVNIYSAVTGSPIVSGKSYVSTIGNGSATEFTINHNLETRDVFVQFMNANSPYENYNVAWEALTLNSIKAYFDEAPASGSVKVVIYSSLSGDLISLNISDLQDVSAANATPEQFLKWDGTNWVNTFSIESIKIDDAITIQTSSTPKYAVNEDIGLAHGHFPFVIASNFPNYAGSIRYPMAYIDPEGNIGASKLTTFSDNTSSTILDSIIQESVSFSPRYSGFTISSKGNMSWYDGTNGAQASLTFGGSFDSGRLTINADVTINSQRSLTSQFTYNNSVGSVRDVFITSSGLLGVNLSSEKYKEDIVNIEIDPQKVYQIQPVEFKYKEGHINEEAKDQRFIGLIAEQLDEIGLTQFVEYDENGSPDSVKYSMLSLALIETVKDLNTRLLNLENK